MLWWFAKVDISGRSLEFGMENGMGDFEHVLGLKPIISRKAECSSSISSSMPSDVEINFGNSFVSYCLCWIWNIRQR